MGDFFERSRRQPLGYRTSNENSKFQRGSVRKITLYENIVGAQGFVRGNTGDIGLKQKYVSQNLYNGTHISAKEQFSRTFLHEYANYLSWFYTGDPATFGVKGGIAGDSTPGGGLRSVNVDDDTGARMEKCIWGNVSF